jgi:murein DD-endopeptidase MepM/ murein hydrolase activator NlpD
MTRTWVRRLAALGLAGCLFAGLVVASAAATSSVDEALQIRHNLQAKIVDLHKERHDRRLLLHRWIAANRARIAMINRQADERGADRSGPRQMSSKHQSVVRRLTKREQEMIRSIKARVTELQAQRRQLADWIETYGIFRYCPVAGQVEVADNFGVLVDIPGVPKHIHQGNDMSAASGTPIVAPFDGSAVATGSELGGLSVDVYGPLGHVYNAHLSSYGQLGAVKAGTVIGYVGTTGDATGPHDHFEWHPNDGAAVDPHVYLMAVC